MYRAIIICFGLLAYFMLCLFVLTNPRIHHHEIRLETTGDVKTRVDELRALLPSGAQQDMNVLSDAYSLSATVLAAVDSDKIVCARVPGTYVRTPHKVVLPEANPFAAALGDAATGETVIENQRYAVLHNPHLKMMQENHKTIQHHSGQILMYMDRTGDARLGRVTRRIEELTEMHASYMHQIVVSCAQQRDRLQDSHPIVANYEFMDESIATGDYVPRYMFGYKQKPVERTRPANGTAGLAGFWGGQALASVLEGTTS